MPLLFALIPLVANVAWEPGKKDVHRDLILESSHVPAGYTWFSICGAEVQKVELLPSRSVRLVTSGYWHRGHELKLVAVPDQLLPDGGTIPEADWFQSPGHSDLIWSAAIGPFGERISVLNPYEGGEVRYRVTLSSTAIELELLDELRREDHTFNRIVIAVGCGIAVLVALGGWLVVRRLRRIEGLKATRTPPLPGN